MSDKVEIARTETTVHLPDVSSEIELEEMNIILLVPKDAAWLKVEAMIVDENGDTRIVTKKLKPSELAECRQKFLDNLYDDDYDAKYVLTEFLDQLEDDRK